VDEIPDSEILRLLRGSPVVSPEQVRTAQELQRDELGRQGSCRSLFRILCEKGLIDERVARSLSVSTRDGIPAEVTPYTPTVVLPPPAQTPAPEQRSGSSPSLSSTRSARRRPPEVEVAAADPRNTLGPYTLVREVGKGGMGRVYRAWDENLGRFVAVKVIDTEDAASRERFVREAQIAGRLHHPSIATVFQAGEEGTRGYIAMQFIEGGAIDSKKPPLLTALSLILDSARALSYAHEQGVVHRDVKPGNLMVDGKGHVFLTDFGLAKEGVANAGTQLSITGTTFGTPQFMSPEQARGEHKQTDGRSDIYSLGATLYALLAQRPPFTSTNLATLLLEVLNKTPTPLSRLKPEISPELEMLVERAMAKDPAKRFPTMALFAEALDRIIREGRYKGRYGMVKSFVRRWVPRLAAAGILGAALWFGIHLIPRPAKAVPADPTPALQAQATSALRTLEGQRLDTAERRERIDRQVLHPLAEVLRSKPLEVSARALKIRALYVQGDRMAAARELAELDGRKHEDYRLLLVSALLQLEAALETPCPLPAIDSPAFEWEPGPASWPPALVAAVEAAAQANVAPDLADEYGKDRSAIDGLAAMATGQNGKAASLLREQPLPVYQAAWCRAAYLDGRFAEVVSSGDSKGRRERFGAGLALAAGSAAALEALLPDAGDDAAVVHAALARLEGVEGLEAHVELGLKAAAPERQAALIASKLRARSLTGSDEVPEYRRAMELAGDTPTTGSGRLAAIELRLGLGGRLLRSRGDGRPLLEEALRRADELVQKYPAWPAPRLLGAATRLRLGRLEEARADLSKLPQEARKGIRACLIASAVELAAAERERKAGSAYEESAKAAQREALGAPRDHVEALTLFGAAALLLAQHEAAIGGDETGFVKAAVESLTRALEQLPACLEARYHRARALFLLAELRRRDGSEGRSEGEAARADADAALAAAPDFLPARYFRGIVHFSLGRDAEAVADWRALLQADATWDTPELRSWILRAEERIKK
jgi:hypothetical protein